MQLDKILVVEVAGVGDAVMSVPALRALRESYPQAQISILVSARALGLLENCPYINKVYPFDIENFRLSGKVFDLARTFKYIRILLELRAQKFDAAINLYRVSSDTGNLRMRALFGLIRPALSAGRKNGRRGAFYRRVVEEETGRHEVETKLAVAGLIEAVSTDKSLKLWITPQDQSQADAILGRCGITDKDLIVGMTPFSYSPNNSLPASLVTGSADRLAKALGAKVILLGGRDSIIKAQLDPRVFCGLIKRLRLLITADSGPAHIGAALDVPEVVVFSGQDPKMYGPYQHKRASVLTGDVPCRPCYSLKICPKRVCLEQITPEDILRAAKRLLGE